ncbi:hypothetical protein SIID45300_02241 [Candidatus Magnetaquicoccaceae bacterium FCR-1]|uniref:Uncharacterized protein n=1 Tax=Candidatus Magnetaquiglobus chichijimensis TaxID=3141448 RepID=A0ABQ0CAJ4_9PROT
MMTWNGLDHARQQSAEALFCALSAERHLNSDELEEATPAIGFAELYRLASQPEQPVTPEMALALAGNPRLEADLKRLIHEQSQCHFPLRAAADSGEETSREMHGFKIRLHPSQAEQAQMYVSIRLAEEKREVPTTLFILKPGHPPIKRHLPLPKDGVIQILEDGESDLVHALKDLDSEIFLSTQGVREEVTVKPVRVVIGTTAGPSEVLQLAPESPEVASVVCLDRTSESLPISQEYAGFVRAPSGVIQKLFGHAAFRMDVSQRIEEGKSWQLGALAAHALLHAQSLAGQGEPVRAVVWLSGEVDTTLRLRPVQNMRRKLEKSRDYLLAQLEAGTPVILSMHPTDRKMLDDAWMKANGMEELIPCLHPVTQVQDLINRLDLEPLPEMPKVAAATVTGKLPRDLKRWLGWLLFLVVVGIGVWTQRDTLRGWLEELFRVSGPVVITQNQAVEPVKSAVEAGPKPAVERPATVSTSAASPENPSAEGGSTPRLNPLQVSGLHLTLNAQIPSGWEVCAVQKSSGTPFARQEILLASEGQFPGVRADNRLCGLVYGLFYPGEAVHLAVGVIPTGGGVPTGAVHWSAVADAPLAAGQAVEIALPVKSWQSADRTHLVMALASTEPLGDLLDTLGRAVADQPDLPAMRAEIERQLQTRAATTVWRVVLHELLRVQ